MSIPVLLLEDTVGKLRRLLEDMFDMVEENLFPRSLMDATIQDSGTRERRDVNDNVNIYIDLHYYCYHY